MRDLIWNIIGWGGRGGVIEFEWMTSLMHLFPWEENNLTSRHLARTASVYGT